MSRSPTLACAVLVAAASLAPLAHAEISSTITLTSDYDFRGFTQTAQDPALQASLDWSADSGLYVGAWASNVDFGPGTDSDIELDLYAGYNIEVTDELSYDIGGVYYTYFSDGDDVDFPEIYAAVNYKDFTGKLWYSWDFGNTSESAWYLEANYSIPLPQDFSIALHAGYSGGDYWDDPSFGFEEYFDYSIGVAKTLGNFELMLKWVDGSDFRSANNTPGDVFSSDSRAIFSIATSLPWQ